jgi:formylglycine-generating enzyme required for sulfatase activity
MKSAGQRSKDQGAVLGTVFAAEIRREMARMNAGIPESEKITIRDRINRLLAYVRLIQSTELVELCCELLKPWVDVPEPEEYMARVQRKGLVMHCLEILKRNRVQDIPGILEKDWLRIHRKTGICLVWIPPGEFWMGSGDDDEAACDGEMPQHRVRIGRGFWMGKYPVTNADYGENANSLTNLENIAGEIDKQESRIRPLFKLWNHPVVAVSWDDAKSFLQRANDPDGMKFRLPNEAEWEYSCRAGGNGPYHFPFGASELGKYDWYWNLVDGSTHGVGLLRGNLWGLFDLHGNVREWCEDVFDEIAYRKRSGKWEARDWTEDDAGKSAQRGKADMKVFRANRGASFGNDDWYCRAADRIGCHPDSRSKELGFRAVLDDVGPGVSSAKDKSGAEIA